MPATLVKPRKLQIRETAEGLFREKGYSATSMRHLASELGIEPASLYSHIKSKEEILRSICFGMAKAFFNALDSVQHSANSLAEQLKLMVVAHTDVVIKNVNASTVFFHDWRHLSEPHLSEFKQLRKEYEMAFRAVLDKGVKTDEFHVSDVPFCVKTMFSAMNMTHEWYRPEMAKPDEQVGEKLAQLLLNGISKNPLKP